MHVYSAYWIGDCVLTNKDEELLLEILYDPIGCNNGNVIQAIPSLYKVNKSAGEKYIRYYLENCKINEGGPLFGLLFDRFQDDSNLHQLLMENSVRFAINNEIESCLLKVFRTSPEEDIFAYFIRRFEYKNNVVNESDYLYYECVPISAHMLLVNKFDVQKSKRLFDIALQWNLNLEENWRIESIARYLIAYLKPSLEITEDIKSIYLQIYSSCKGNFLHVRRLVESISEFHNKTKELICLVSSILEDARSRFANDGGKLKELILRAREAITTSGGKQGTPGKPFPFDIRLKALIEEVLPNYEEHSLTYRILQDSLHYVNRAISRETLFEKDDW
ncbi:hypothetical protein [Chitinophaga barathri]|uniref:Uncharacterized protein n=1 Tax=Chitinophaga barathri TaxID=1647451 RepID=A0A3N4MC54_9BACT|nr:hypothetical protein [Chitinophaga barathri]RPD39436.1 hypothetical protein EG028_20150 [Chitinophaga barathri]